MLVITQNTQEAFEKEMDAAARKKDTWRCIVLKFSKLMEKPRNWFFQAIDKINHCLGESSGKIFGYANGDIHILTRFVTPKSFAFLLTHLTGIFKTEIKELASLYELPVDEEKVRKINRPGNVARDVREAEKPEKIEVAFRSAELYIDAIHAPHVASIAARRDKRVKPLALIIEDDVFSQRLVGKSIEHAIEFAGAEKAQEALFSYIRLAPDVVFLDIGLPDHNGLEALTKIFEIDPAAYVVMLSGSGSKENVLKAVQLGAKGFVGKPFPREKLIQYIQKCSYVTEKLRRDNRSTDIK